VIKRLTATLFYRLLRFLTTVDIPTDAGEFRLLSRRVVEQLKSMRERRRFMRGMTSWVGFPHAVAYYCREPRAAGQTKYSFRKMIHLAFDAITSFSSFPLQLASYFGLLSAVLSFALLGYAIFAKLVHSTVVGWASQMAVITFLGGIQLVMIGVIGSYLARIYDEVRQRPLYVVAATEGWEPGAARPSHHSDEISVRSSA